MYRPVSGSAQDFVQANGSLNDEVIGDSRDKRGEIAFDAG